MVFSLINNPSEMPHIFIASCLCACFLSAWDSSSLKQYLTNKYFAFLQYPVGYTGWPSVFSGHGDHQVGETQEREGSHETIVEAEHLSIL